MSYTSVRRWMCEPCAEDEEVNARLRRYNMRLDQKRILITGGGSGIGLALARALSRHSQVAIVGRDEQKLERAKVDMPDLHTFPVDVTSESEAIAAVTWIEERLGGMDLLINSAGVLRTQAFDSPEAESTAAEHFSINVLGSARMTRVALPLLRRSDDAGVVFLSSGLALGASPGLAVYAATKAAVHSLARSLRYELRGEVKVFDFLPPFVATSLAGRWGRDAMPVERVAEDMIRAIKRDRFEVRIGRVKVLSAMGRLSTPLADVILARELGR